MAHNGGTTAWHTIDAECHHSYTLIATRATRSVFVGLYAGMFQYVKAHVDDIPLRRLTLNAKTYSSRLSPLK